MSGAGARPRVLVVEDEPMVLEVACEELLDAGFEVVPAESGDVAVETLRSGAAFDLLLTDIRMPGRIDGWGVAETARQVQPAIAVIYATGFSGDQGGMVTGAVLLNKPYRVEAVIEIARRLGVPIQAR